MAALGLNLRTASHGVVVVIPWLICQSVVESIAQLNPNLSRRHPVDAAKRGAVVEQVTAVCDVPRVERHAPVLAELFAQSQIDANMAGQMIWGWGFKKLNRSDLFVVWLCACKVGEP